MYQSNYSTSLLAIGFEYWSGRGWRGVDSRSFASTCVNSETDDGSTGSTSHYLNPFGCEFHYPPRQAAPALQWVDTTLYIRTATINKEIDPLELEIATCAFYKTHETFRCFVRPFCPLFLCVYPKNELIFTHFRGNGYSIESVISKLPNNISLLPHCAELPLQNT